MLETMQFNEKLDFNVLSQMRRPSLTEVRDLFSKF